MNTKEKFENISMNGRIAYVIMCVEKFLVTKYPDRDWTIIAREMWKETNEYLDEFYDAYSGLVPEIFLDYSDYDSEELGKAITPQEFEILKKLYAGITEGKEDDPTDEVNFMLNKPFEMAMVYEGTHMGDGHESFEIIDATEKILFKNNISLPDYTKVQFTTIKDHNGWGNHFDGTHLSIILN